ncbi:MAG TPA: 50S ribosomal protein L4 [Ilumatobacter sp.]
MAQITLKNAAGKDAGKVDLDDATFGIQPNVPVMHQVVTAQLAARRAGTQSTKTRAEVRGGGAKPYRQKGTGNARQGSIRSPQYSGGGVALGPKPRKYDQKTPKKMISLALRSALSDRANEGKVIVVDSWGWDKPSTRAAVKALSGLGTEGRVLVVVGRDDAAAALSFRNIPEVQLIAPAELNAYDVLRNDWIVFTQDLLPTFEGSAKQAATVAADEDTEVAEEIEADEDAVDAQAAEAEAAEEATVPSAFADLGEIESDTPGNPVHPYGAGSHVALRDDAQPEGFPVKGNASSMLYHLPGTAFYGRTNAEVWFATADDAEAAGFARPESQQGDDVPDAGDAAADAVSVEPYGPGSYVALAGDVQPEGFAIKGNANSMLYHTPDSSFYDRTNAEVWFATEADAEAAGFSKPASQKDDD